MNRHIRTVTRVAILATVLVGFTAGIVGTPLYAEPLTVDRAVELALEHSPALAARTAALAADDARVSVARTALLPQVSLSASYQRVDTRDPAEIAGMTLGDEITDAASMGVTVQQPLFTGGAAVSGVALADVQSRIQMQQIVFTRRDTIHQTRAAYWAVVEATERLDAIRDRLTQVRSMVADSENRVAAGVLTRSDLLAVQMSQAETEMQELRARNSLEVAVARLRMLTGIDTDAAISPTSRLSNLEDDRSAEFTGENSAPLEEFIARALANRSDLETLRLVVAANDESIRSIAAGRFPQLFAIGSFSYASPAPNTFPADSGFGTTWSVGVAGRYELGSRPRINRSIQAAREDRLATEAQLQAAEQQVTLEVRMNYLGWQTSTEEIAVAQTMVRQAEENLQETQTRVRTGTALRTEELDAETKVLEAQLALTSARVGRQTAWDTLLRSTGELE